MFILYSLRRSQENYSKGHRSAAHGPHPACCIIWGPSHHSCIIWSTTQHDKNQEILKFQFLNSQTWPVSPQDSWLALKNHHTLPYTQHCAFIDILLILLAFESLISAPWK